MGDAHRFDRSSAQGDTGACPLSARGSLDAHHRSRPPGCYDDGVATVTFGDFEWDSEKAEANVVKHGVTFEEASTVFLDLDYLLVRDSETTNRFVAIGMSGRARVLFVVHCERGERVRIISARRATRRERESYERRQESE